MSKKYQAQFTQQPIVVPLLFDFGQELFPLLSPPPFFFGLFFLSLVIWN